LVVICKGVERNIKKGVRWGGKKRKKKEKRVLQEKAILIWGGVV